MRRRGFWWHKRLDTVKDDTVRQVFFRGFGWRDRFVGVGIHRYANLTAWGIRPFNKCRRWRRWAFDFGHLAVLLHLFDFANPNDTGVLK